MAGCNDENCENCKQIKFDGSGGIGDYAKLTITTRDDIEGEKRETFLFPYVLINQTLLTLFVTYKQIQGFELLRVEKLKDGQ